jgi:protein phosphatase
MKYKWEFAGASEGKKEKNYGNDDNLYCNKNFGIVADGVGGNKRGDVASKRAVEEGRKKIQDLISLGLSEDKINPSIEKIIKELGTKIYEEALNDITKANMQATFTLAVKYGNNVYIANIGDSPAFVFESGKLRKATTELDSYLMRKVDDSITEEELFRKIHLDEDYLLSSLGSEEDIEPNIYDPINLKNIKYIVLCTDGVSKLVTPTELESILKQGLSPKEVVREVLAIVSNPKRAAEISGKKPEEIANQDDATLVVFKSMEEKENGRS